MFINQLRYLVSLAEERHFLRAAQRCNVTQPTLSHAIMQLEHELGVPVLLRGRGRNIQRLTAEGERVAALAAGVLAHCDAMQKEAAMMRSRLAGTIRIGAMSSMSSVLPLLVGVLRQTYPGLTADVRFLGDDAMRLSLSNFSLDVAITYLDELDFDRKNALSIFTDKFSLLVPDCEIFRGRHSISWKEAAQLPLAMLSPAMRERQVFNRIFEEMGCKPSVLVESDSMMHLMFQVQTTELCTLVPSHFVNAPGLYRGTRALPLTDPILTKEVGLLWTGDDTAFPLANVFRLVVKNLKESGELARHLEGGEHPMHSQRASNNELSMSGVP